MEQDVARIIAELTAKEKEVADLKAKLESLQKDSHTTASLHPMKDISSTLDHLRKKASLNNDEIMRYSRQLLLPEFGVKGQVNLLKTSVLIVGCGGLGCPVAQYLASAGIGRLGLLDYDTVELSNLHRQVLHGENRIGWPKAFSAAESLKRLNSTVECIPYHVQLTPENAMQLIQQYPFFNSSGCLRMCSCDIRILYVCLEFSFAVPYCQAFPILLPLLFFNTKLFL
ncbi:MOCS3 sulfurtransferase, partial [Polypterus senegalus]